MFNDLFKDKKSKIIPYQHLLGTCGHFECFSGEFGYEFEKYYDESLLRKLKHEWHIVE